jgi:hypothetical protein
METFPDDFVHLVSCSSKEVYSAACEQLDIDICIEELKLPPGPPGFNRMVLFPVAEAFVASILMRGIENVLSEDLLK